MNFSGKCEGERYVYTENQSKVKYNLSQGAKKIRYKEKSAEEKILKGEWEDQRRAMKKFVKRQNNFNNGEKLSKKNALRKGQK